MSGLTSVMSTAKTGLTAAQLAIAVTGENISNVDTEGYSRRTVTFAEAFTVDGSVGQIGSGVWAEDIQRHFSQYVENQYYDQATLRDRWNSLYTNLSNAESLFNESSGYGLSDTISKFFTSWTDLTQQPEDASSRNSVVESSQTLISTLNQIDSNLDMQQQQADMAIVQQVAEVNDILEQVATLNKEINSSSVSTANSLLDQRSALVRTLSGYLDIHYIDKGDGNITITTKAGQTLVDGSDHFSISYDAPETTKSLKPYSTFTGDVYFSGSDNQEYTLEVVQGGNVSSGAGAAQFRVSVDGGNSWLTDANGNELHYSARTQGTAAAVGTLNIWFGSNADASVAPSTALTTGDRFSIVPMRGLYWNENTSTKENITPFTDGSGNDDSRRLTGGTLTALCNYKNDYVGAYREKLDAIAKTVAWEVNRIHSQGTGLTNLTDVHGTYSVVDDTRALGSGSSGLIYGSKLTSGSAFMYVYNTSTGLLVSGAALDFSGNGTKLNFDPKTDSLDDVAAAVNDTFGTYLTASVVNHQLTISAKDGYSFNMGTDTTGIYAALGLNTYFTGSTCRDLGINTAITADQDHLNTGHVNGAGEANQGDITTASAIAGLSDSKVSVSTLRGGTVSQTISGYYNGLVSSVGADTAQASYKYTYTNALAQDLDDQQQSISGVNLDEEMTNLIKYQHAYTAAAKLITTADQMMQTLLALKS